MKGALLCLLPLLALRAAAEDEASPEMAAIQAEFDEMMKGGEDKRQEAADRIARMDPFPASALAGYLESRNKRYRHCAILAFEYAGAASKSAVTGLALLMFEPDFHIRTGALAALRAIGPDAAAAIPSLMKVMLSKDTIMRGGAAELLLYGMGDAGRDALKAAISGPESATVMLGLTDALSFYRAGPWALLAEVLSKEKDVWKRLAAAKNGRLCRYEPGADAIVPVLARSLLEDEDAAVRAACAASLAEPAALNPDLRELALTALEASAREDPDEGVKKAAEAAAKKLRPRR
ncbi:MAG: HEAT domain containing [Planctomycetota bacterium]|nr:MAG: HEAT domain containing [Planctomycetota bacterium]